MDASQIRTRLDTAKRDAALRSYLERRIAELELIAAEAERQVLAARTAAAEMRAALHADQGAPNSGSEG